MDHCKKDLKKGDFVVGEVEISFGDGIIVPHGRIDAMVLLCIDTSPPIYVLTNEILPFG